MYLKILSETVNVIENPAPLVEEINSISTFVYLEKKHLLLCSLSDLQETT